MSIYRYRKGHNEPIHKPKINEKERFICPTCGKIHNKPKNLDASKWQINCSCGSIWEIWLGDSIYANKKK